MDLFKLNDIQKFQYISLCQKIMKELEVQAQFSDKTVAEFLIHLSNGCSGIEEYLKNLKENEVDLPVPLIKSIFGLIQAMFPASLTKPQPPTSVAKPIVVSENEDVAEVDDPHLITPSPAVGDQKSFQNSARAKAGVALRFPALTIRNSAQGFNMEELNVNMDFSTLENGGKEPEVKEKAKEKAPEPKEAEERKDKRKERRKDEGSEDERDRQRRHRKDKKRKDYKSRRGGTSVSSTSRSRSRDKGSSKGLSKGEPELNKIYEGRVTKIAEYGCFVNLVGFRKKIDGLVHHNNIATRRIKNVADAVKLDQPVKVKVVSKEGRKIGLSIKEVDQISGQDLNPLLPDGSHAEPPPTTHHHQPRLDTFDDDLYVNPMMSMRDGSQKYGALTGIKLDDDIYKTWLRLSYFAPEQVHNVFGDQDLSEEELQEKEVEVEINDKEPLFLTGQTGRTRLNLSPIRMTKNPEGTMSRAAMNAIEYSKERKELREQHQRQYTDTIPKELSKYWEDPNVAPGARPLAAQLKGLATPANSSLDPTDSKKDSYSRFNNNSGGANGGSSSSRRHNSRSMNAWKENLPIYKFKKDLVDAINKNRVLIVIGETGSGKTTQITQYLVEMCLGSAKKKIGCTQPRRVAAMSVAKRVAEEMNVTLGEEVGYAIRFEDVTSSKTIIKYLTDGMLLRECLLDINLSSYGVIVLDEAHERTVQTDVLFGLLKQTLLKRDDFKVIVTSATLEADKFSEYFFRCNIFTIPGRNFPVKTFWKREPVADYLDEALILVQQLHLTKPPGDILLFLTGQEEIDTAVSILNERMKKLGAEAPELIILPIYSALPSESQTRIFEPAPYGSRKCVIATNIAEASLTIDGIYYVVDPGFAKIKVFNPKLGMDALAITPISQASANQRMGRAGRTGPGECYRLYTESAYENEMLPVTIPEIQRTNLANTVLLLKAMGINDLLNFNFMDPPHVQTMISALQQLYDLSALDDEGLLTRLGLRMAEFPLEPQLAKMLLTSVDLGCSSEIVTIVAMLSSPNVFYRPREKQALADQKKARFFSADGDHLTLLNVYEAWEKNKNSNVWCHENYIQARALKRAQDIRKQIVSILERYRLKIITCNGNSAKVRKAISAGYFQHAARRDPQGGYRTMVDNQQVYIHPSSSLFNKVPETVVYHELVQTSKEYMRDICVIEAKWLVDVAPNFYKAADPDTISKRKRMEKLEPLNRKFEEEKQSKLPHVYQKILKSNKTT